MRRIQMQPERKKKNKIRTAPTKAKTWQEKKIQH